MKHGKPSYQAGFGAVEVILIVIVIGLAGTLGWVAYTKLTKNNAINVQESSGIADLKKPVEINSSKDIDDASKDIDDVDINDEDALSDAENAVNSLD